MRKRGNRILLLTFAVIMTVGCAAKQTGKEDEVTPQDNIQQADDGNDVGESVTETEGEDLSDRGEMPDPVPVLSEEFDCEVWETEKTKVGMPGGVLAVGDHLLVCDMGNHCVVRLTTDGDFVESYGELGSDAGNFVMPTAILFHEEEIYVLDSGNMRIQVFDLEMNFISEILFEGSPLPRNGKYSDMAIAGDGTIYVATDEAYEDAMCLFYLEGEKLCGVQAECMGYLAEQNGVVYTADKYRHYTYQGGNGWKSGENWVYRVDRTGVEKVCELPYMYTSMDFAVTDDQIYTLSSTWGKLSCFTMEGEALNTMFYMEEVQGNEMYLSMQDENTFYVADTEGYLYKIFRKGE